MTSEVDSESLATLRKNIFKRVSCKLLVLYRQDRQRPADFRNISKKIQKITENLKEFRKSQKISENLRKFQKISNNFRKSEKIQKNPENCAEYKVKDKQEPDIKAISTSCPIPVALPGEHEELSCHRQPQVPNLRQRSLR